MAKKDFFTNFFVRLRKMFRKQGVRIAGIFLLAFTFSLFPSPNDYFQTVKKTGGIFIPKEISLPSPPPYPVNQTGKQPPDLSAAAILVKDLASGVVIYAKDEKTRFPSASTTKIIASLVALDNYKLDDVITVKKVINEGKTMGLVQGEKLTFESLLYGSLVHSANDATYVLADNFPGGTDKFVEKMNEKVKNLGLTETNFTNPVGFDDPNHYTTASDLAKQAEVALSNKTIAKIVGTKAITVSDVNFTYFHDLKNVNELLGRVAGVSGVKTGFTQNAGEVLVSEVKKNGQTVLFVILKSADRFGETTKLIDWVFNNFVWVPFMEIIPASQK